MGASLVVIAGIVYLAGGTQTVLPHLFYLPIVLGGFLYRFWGGTLTGLVAGLLCGPLMPLDTELGHPQQLTSWLVRLVMFVAIGVITGALVEALWRRMNDLRQIHETSIRAFVQTIEAKSPYTARHSEKVAEYAVRIAQELGQTPAQVEALRWTALLHDIGKLCIPDVILNKSGSLTPDEWEIMKRHPIDSVRLLESVTYFHGLFPAIRHHHERLDGRGYPDGLAGDRIPLTARILAVADAFDAMTSERPYRSALREDEALGQMHAAIGTQFDVQVVEAMTRVLQPGIGLDHQRGGLVGDQQAITTTLAEHDRHQLDPVR